MIIAIRQQLNLWHLSIRAGEYPDLGFNGIRTLTKIQGRSMRIIYGIFWNTLLQQKRRGLKNWFAGESFLHWLIKKLIGESKQTHTLMMRHER